MFRLVVALAALFSVTAFIAPSSRMASRSAMKMSFDASGEAGVTSPLGYWDPLGLAKDQETFDQYRASELKHGRVAQLAVIGYIVPEVFKVC